MTIDPNTSFSNNSSNSTAVYSAFSDDTSTVEVLFEEDLTLIETADNDKSVPKKTDTTLLLNQTYVDPDTQQPTQLILYTIIFVSPSTLFPLGSQSEPLSFKTNTFSPMTLTDDMTNSVYTSLQFFYNWQAYPDSYQGFYDACSSGYKNNDVEPEVDAYFQGTENYKTATFQNFCLIATFAEMYVLIYTGNEPSRTFYLYYISSTGSSSQNGIKKVKKSLERLKKKARCSLDINLDTSSTNAGTIVFKKKANAPAMADSKDHNCGYDIFYTDPSGNQTRLYYDHGQLVSKLGSTAPAICLLAAFVPKSSVTGNSSDTTIVPIFAGTLNGPQAMGSNFEADTSTSTPFTADTFFKYLGDALSLIFGGMLLWKAGELLGKKLSWIKAKNEKANPSGTDEETDPTPSQINQAKQETNDQITQIEEPRLNTQLTNANMSTTTVTPPTDANVKNLQNQKMNMKTEQATEAQVQEITTDVNRVELDAKYSNSPSIQSAAEGIDQSVQKLEPAVENVAKAEESGNTEEINQSYEDLSTTLTDNRPDLDTVNDQLTTIEASESSKMSSTAKSQTEKNQKIQEETSEIQEQITEEQEQIKDGTDGKGVEGEDGGAKFVE